MVTIFNALNQNNALNISGAVPSANSANAILQKFADRNEVGAQVRSEVAYLIQQDIIRGSAVGGELYLNPQDGVTRAEAVAIIYRSMNTSSVFIKNIYVTNPANNSPYTINTPDKAYTVSGDKFIITGETKPGSRVKVDNIEADVTSNGMFTSKTIESDFSVPAKRYEIVSTNGSAGGTTAIAVNFEANAPTVQIISAPSASSSSGAEISGKVTDKNMDGMKLYLNDKTASLNSDGSFRISVNVEYGTNAFTVKAVNKLGLEASQTVTVTRDGGSVSITGLNYSEITLNKTEIISGTVSADNKDGLKLYINNKQVSLDSSGKFSYTANLSDGVNTFALEANNAADMNDSKTVTIIKSAGTLAIGGLDYPESTTEKTANISGIVTAESKDGLKLYVNNKSVPLDNSGRFNYTASALTDGDNIFKLEASNGAGASDSKTITIIKENAVIPAPTISLISDIPAKVESDVKALTVNLKITNAETVYINNKTISLDSNGYLNNYNWTLSTGANALTIKVVGKNGETKEQTVSCNKSEEAKPYPADAVAYGGHHYKLFPSMSWKAGKEYCEKQGGHLATVTSQNENAFIYELLEKNGLNSCQLGATDEVTEGKWMWVTGESWSYTNWAKNTANGAQARNQTAEGMRIT
jgi:hypothetical protein